MYGRLYPLLLVRTDGSTIHIRYKEPKRILMVRDTAQQLEIRALRGVCCFRCCSLTLPSLAPQLPLDSSTLPEAERKARLRRQFPSKLQAKQEEALEELDLEKYKKFWKK